MSDDPDDLHICSHDAQVAANVDLQKQLNEAKKELAFRSIIERILAPAVKATLPHPENRQEGESAIPTRDQEVAEYLASSLGQRDLWIFQQRKKGLTNPQVIKALEKIFVDQSWEPLTTDQGIRDALKRYHQKTSTSPLQVNKGGRPRKENPQVKTTK